MLHEMTVNADRTSPQEMKRAFDAYGGVLVRGLIPQEQVESFRCNISRMIRARLAAVGQPADGEDDIDALFNRLCEFDRKLGSEVYDHIRDLPEFYDLVRTPSLVRVVQAVLGTDVFQIPFDLALFRVDRPSEERFTFDWHQDYPYNLLSVPAVTAWIPLTDVTADMGRLRIVPRSHDRIREVRIVDPSFKVGAGGGGKALYLHNIHVAELEEQAIDMPVNAGDALIFHCLLIHRSGQNQSQRSRWVANPRFGKMLDPNMVQRGWYSVNRSRFIIFHEIHPDLAHIVES